MNSPTSDGDHGRSQDQRHEAAEETTPLLLSRTRSLEPATVESIVVPIESEDKPVDSTEPALRIKRSKSTRWLILLCAFITSLSFGVTQAPILWIFRVMTCDAYFKNHPSDLLHAADPSTSTSIFHSLISTGSDTQRNEDRCAIRAIDSATALSMSLLGASTTIFGVINLFLTGNLIKRIGLKYTLLIQVLFAAVRLFIQNIAVEVGGSSGILLFQCSQIVSILGGPSGYVLVLNNFITEVVDHEGRTAALGILQGCMMFGMATGFLLGGLMSDWLGNKAPFRLTFLLFLSSSIYAALFMHSITPEKSDPTKATQAPGDRKGFARFFGPLAVFMPKRFIGKDNIVRTEYGTFLLACGVFLGINATGYIPTLLQLYSTDEFGFKAKENGYLIFMYSLLRGLFLTLAFPRLIKLGRRWTTQKEDRARVADSEVGEREGLLTPPSGTKDTPEESVTKKQETFTFDLQYTRFSLIADGVLTLLCSFVREGWQMYLVAAILPFAAGTGSAAKGTILQMVGSSASSNERTDALAGVSLIENIARLSTTFMFGVIFAGFASIGRLELVFVCNAGFALIGFGILLFARFPPEGSRPVEVIQQERDD